MNLEKLAAFRGEAWARRVLRDGRPARSSSSSEQSWPGKMDEARRLARSFGKPKLVETLAAIIQQCATATWISPAGS
jgi:hypothetical protein